MEYFISCYKIICLSRTLKKIECLMNLLHTNFVMKVTFHMKFGNEFKDEDLENEESEFICMDVIWTFLGKVKTGDGFR